MESLNEIITSVQGYYSEAFKILFYYTLGIIAFVGVIIPLVVTFIQNKIFKSDNKRNINELKRMSCDLEKTMEVHIDKYFESKEKDFFELLEKKIEKNKILINEISAKSDAKVLHVQAQTEFQNEKYLNAFVSSVGSASSYIDANDELNLQRILKTTEDCLFELNKDLLSNDVDNSEETFLALLKKFKKINQNGRYDDLKSNLNIYFKDAKERE